MALLAIIGLLIVAYYLIYIILPFFLDCDFLLAFMEKFGKSVCKYILVTKRYLFKLNETSKYDDLEII